MPKANDGLKAKTLLAKGAIADGATREGRHLAFKGRDGVHRVLIAGNCTDDMLNALTVMDRHMPLRLYALSNLHAWLAGSARRLARHDVPTAYQAARLELMLRVLDALIATGSGRSSAREIAGEILYPRARFANSIEWKISSERRQTLRLIAQAVALRDGGYLKLLLAYNSQAK